MPPWDLSRNELFSVLLFQNCLRESTICFSVSVYVTEKTPVLRANPTFRYFIVPIFADSSMHKAESQSDRDHYPYSGSFIFIFFEPSGIRFGVSRLEFVFSLRGNQSPLTYWKIKGVCFGSFAADSARANVVSYWDRRLDVS